jgi:autoinducer 2-degrading protein
MYISAMSKIFLDVAVDVRPGKFDEFIVLLKKHIEMVRAEPGCELIEIFQDPENSDVVTIWEIWSDRKSWDVHMECETSKKWHEVAADYVFGEKISLLPAL